MASSDGAGIGQIGWLDLTVKDAGGIRDFYQDVTGWRPLSVSMGEYQDYCMKAANGQSVAGICHARGQNANVPAVWLMYIVVADLDESMRRCVARGGKLLGAPRSAGTGKRFCLIQDPEGAISALYESRAQAE